MEYDYSGNYIYDKKFIGGVCRVKANIDWEIVEANVLDDKSYPSKAVLALWKDNILFISIAQAANYFDMSYQDFRYAMQKGEDVWWYEIRDAGRFILLDMEWLDQD